jgi:polysaccharide biosynthesis/export protein
MKQIFLASLMICGIWHSAIGQSASPNSVRPAIGSQSQSRRGSAQPLATLPANSTSSVAEDFVIGPEDVLEINVWKEPDLTRKVTVGADGRISIPLLNEIQAGGLTRKQLKDRITEGLARFVEDPLVTIIVLEVHSQVVSILGAVARPGAYPLGASLTVVDLLALAGGFREFAKTVGVVIVRQEKDVTRRFPFNWKTYVGGRDFQQNIVLKNGDKVIVP